MEDAAVVYVCVLLFTAFLAPIALMDSDFDFTPPQYVAMWILWPITLATLVVMGGLQFVRTPAGAKSLSRRQERNLRYQKEMLAIEKERERTQQEYLRLLKSTDYDG